VTRPATTRADGRELGELRALATRHPELAGAVALQIELVTAERRVRSRLATPWPETSTAGLQARVAAGTPAVRFDDLTIDWNECRLLFRQVADALRRHDAVEKPEGAHLVELGRQPDLPDLARRWFVAAPGFDASPRPDASLPDMLDDVLQWALRPVLTRLAEVLLQRLTLDDWTRSTCPLCGGAPALAYITPAAERLLACGRCDARWRFDQTACPFCANRDHRRIATFATPDGWYRVAACQVCERYVKMLDGRRAGRPLLPMVDAIATLPLDAAAMQKGFR
jgi:hypothetical protein